MLNTGPWNRLSLTIQWLKQEYYEHFPVNKPPPTHMPIAYGEIITVNKEIEQTSRKNILPEGDTSTDSVPTGVDKDESQMLPCSLCSGIDQKVRNCRLRISET